ncbi:MAG: AfsR/SARP family transcriptional regulator, partial [Pseudonocardiaceae bacterium]
MTAGVDVWVRLLGPFEVERSGKPVMVSSARQRAVLAELALAPGRSVSADALAAVVWGGESPEHLRRSLHTVVARLRRQVGGDVVATTTDG